MKDGKDIEQLIIGCLINSFVNHKAALGIVRNHHFYEARHQNIYRAIETLNEKQGAVDIITVGEEVKKLGLLEQIGGKAYIGELAKSYTYEPIEQYCYFLLESFLKREVQLLGVTIQNRASDPISDIFEVIAQTENQLSDLVNGIATKETESVGEIKNLVLSEMDQVLTTGRKLGIPQSVEKLYAHTGGWQRGNLIILAGRPGMGKTAAAIDFALYPAVNDLAVAFFSMEMPKEEIVGRIMSVQSSVPSQQIINKTLTRDTYNYLYKNTEQLAKVPLYIDDTPTLTLYQLRTKARQLKRKHDIQMIVIDYLQLMGGSGKKGANREQEISEISRGLKALAKELSIPIIALSQLNRGVEDRPGKKPQLSDLRESGAIEQDADMVLFLFRPEYYDIQTYETDKGEIPSAGLLMFIVAKFRNGSTGEIRARFIAENTMIANYNN